MSKVELVGAAKKRGLFTCVSAHVHGCKDCDGGVPGWDAARLARNEVT